MEKSEVDLEILKTNNQLFVEYNKMVTENAMRAQRGLLLCHGGAITAILMSGKAWLLPYTLLFACGAMLAVVSSALGYVANWCYMESWGYYTNHLPAAKVKNTTRAGYVFHALALCAYLASVILFGWNIYALWKTFPM
jgi:hypothetical protein